MSEHRAQVRSALDVLRVRSATSYSWCGTTNVAVSPELEHAMGVDVARDVLVYRLQQELYGNFYCRGFPAPATRQAGRSADVNSSAFVEALSAANHAGGTLQPGWRIRETDQEQLVVERDGLALWVTPDQTAPEDRANYVRLRLRSELRKASPGFYMALGEQAITEQDGATLVRLYWHLTSSAAASLLDMLTDALNRAELPFQLKVISDPGAYSRCDAGVLYAPRTIFDELAKTVTSVHRRIAGQLRAGTPVFTKRLAPGLGLAEDPGDGQSFGMHRAGLLARAVVRAYELGYESEDDRTTVVEEVFAEHGLDLDRPYLRPGSHDDYALIVA